MNAESVIVVLATTVRLVSVITWLLELILLNSIPLVLGERVVLSSCKTIVSSANG